MSSANNAEPLVKCVGIWVRVSTEDQAKGESPEHHEQRARYYAQAKGWDVVKVYRLEGVSGKLVKDHPLTQQMLADVRQGKITALIFSKLARLARSTRDLLDFADHFHECGADLISLQESIDTSTAAGRLFFTIVAAMAEWERAEIAERVAASVPIRAKLGKPLGGQAPYGYQWKDGALVPDPAEVPVRKLVYELFLEHRRKKTVARLLNDAGHRTRGGARWSDTTVDRLIRDPLAKGVRRSNYTKSLGNGKNWKLKPESEWVLTEVEAIVPEDLWNQCNRILDDRRAQRTKRPGRKPAQLFAGLAYCQCGHKMYVPSNSPKYICNKCHNKIPIDDLEGVYYEQLRGFFTSPDEMTQLLTEADETIRQKGELLQVLVKERDKLAKELDGYYELYLKGEIPAQGFGKRTEPMQQRLDQIEQQLPELEAEIDFLKINLLSQDEIVNEATDLYSRWPELDFDEKRQIVENITERVVIGKDSISINLCYLPVAPEVMATRQHDFTGSSRPPA